MKNLGLLNKKCAGWKPSDVVTYVKKCDHLSLMERQFAEQLSAAMEAISKVATGKKIFLYNAPKNTWAAVFIAAYEKAEVLFEENGIADISIRLTMFKPEPDFIYFLIEAKQENETVELLFLEEVH